MPVQWCQFAFPLTPSAWGLLAGAGLRVKRGQRQKGQRVSDTDSFIDEVTEEVRRDRLFRVMRRYGWIAVLGVVLLVAGASWNEWRKAQAEAAAQELGDQILSAIGAPDAALRASALEGVEVPEGPVRSVVALLQAGEQSDLNPEQAAADLMALAQDPAVPQIYRQIAVIKAVALPGNGQSEQVRRTQLEALLGATGLVRLLAQEQLALIDLETGAREAGLERLRAIAEDAEVTPGLRQRASQVIVSLGQNLKDTAE